MVETTNFKNKYLKYKLKYQKLINNQNQKGGMKDNHSNTTDTIMNAFMSRQPKQYEAPFMEVIFSDIVEQITNQLYFILFNVPKDISLNDILDNLKIILNIINLPELINMCKSDQSVYNYCKEQNMFFEGHGDNFSILYKLSQLQTMSDAEFNDLKSTSFRPYIKLLEKYRNTSYNGMTLMDIIQLVNDYINIQDNRGRTPLHLAMEIFKCGYRCFAREYHEMAKILIKNNAHLNIQNNHGDTPLLSAIEFRNTEIAKLLIEAGANVNIPNKNGTTPLHHVLFYDNTEIAIILIEKGADLNIKDRNGDTPLHKAIFNNNTEIAIILIQNLIENGTDLNIQDYLNSTPLHYAAQKGNTEIPKLLIEAGANLNTQDVEGQTPLHHAVNYKNNEIAKLLIEAGADLNIKDIESGYTPLEYAIDQGNTEIADLLRQHGASAFMSRQPNQFQGNFMEVFFNRIVKEIKDQLYNELFYVPQDISAKDIIDNLKTILSIINIPQLINMCESDQSVNHYCNQNMDFIQFGDDDSILYKLSQLQTMSDAEFNHLKSTSFPPYITLLEKYRNTSYNGMTLMDVIQLVNDYINYEDNLYARTPLYYSLYNGYDEMVKLLIENGADVNIQDDYGKTPLQLAVEYNNDEMVKLLIENGADLNIQNNDTSALSEMEPGMGNTSLHWAIYNNTEMAELLIEMGAQNPNTDLNIENKWGETPLKLALEREESEIVQLLIENLINVGADLNIPDKYGTTLLSYLAGIGEDIDIALCTILIPYLVAQNANLNIPNKYGETPLHFAIRENNTEMAILLITEILKQNPNADLNIQDHKGNTPLIYAVMQDNNEIADLLRQHGATE